jgi:hypothetical protein
MTIVTATTKMPYQTLAGYLTEKFMRIATFALYVSAFIVPAFSGALADQWSNWQSVGGLPLSVRYVQVTPQTCALAFRNDSASYFNGARLSYFHSGMTDQDVLPSMGPGQSIGGWAAFSVQDFCGNIRVSVYQASWR